MSVDRIRNLAIELTKLGVSPRGIQELLLHPPELVERQLAYLPYRKAKRPEALIIEAVRHNYSIPKQFYYASLKAQRSKPIDQLDPGAELPDPDGDADPLGHGTEDSAHHAAANGGLEQARPDDRGSLPEADGLDWSEQ